MRRFTNRITSRISDPVLIATALLLVAVLVVLGACGPYDQSLHG